MRKTLSFATVFVVFFFILVFTQIAVAEIASAFDSQSLVGEWWGEWSTLNGQFSDRIYITVKKIEGNKVFGVVEAAGADKYLRYEKFEGTLEGNVLSITLSKLWLRLTIEGKTMEGNAWGGQESRLKLVKHK